MKRTTYVEQEPFAALIQAAVRGEISYYKFINKYLEVIAASNDEVLWALRLHCKRRGESREEFKELNRELENLTAQILRVKLAALRSEAKL